MIKKIQSDAGVKIQFKPGEFVRKTEATLWLGCVCFWVAECWNYRTEISASFICPCPLKYYQWLLHHQERPFLYPDCKKNVLLFLDSPWVTATDKPSLLSSLQTIQLSSLQKHQEVKLNNDWNEQINSMYWDQNSFSLFFFSVPVKTSLMDPPVLFSFLTDDGTGPEKIAHIMGPPDQCQHAASIITDLLQSIRAREEGEQVGTVCRGCCMLLFTSVTMKRRNLALLLNCGMRLPRVLRVQGCHLVGEDGVEAKEAGVHLEEKWPSPFLLTNVGLSLAEEERMWSPLTNRLAHLWKYLVSPRQMATQTSNSSPSEGLRSRLIMQSSSSKKRSRCIRATHRAEMHNSNSCQKGTMSPLLSFTFSDFFLCCSGSIVSSWRWWPWSRRPRWTNGSL